MANSPNASRLMLYRWFIPGVAVGTSPRRDADAASRDRPPTASGDREPCAQGLVEGVSGSSGRAGETIPNTPLSHIPARPWNTSGGKHQASTIQLTHRERYFLGCALNAGGCWRGDHTRQLKLKTSKTTPDMRSASHLSALMVPRSVDTELQWQSRSYLASDSFFEDQDFARIMVTTRQIWRFGGGPMAQSNLESRGARKDNLKHARRARRRLQSWSRRLARSEHRTEQGLHDWELPDWPDSSVYAPSTNESDEDDFDYGAVID